MKSKMALASLLALALLGLAPAGYSEPKIINFEEGIEGATVKLTLDRRLNGVARVRPCPTCKPLRLAVTPATRLVKNGRQIPLTQDINLRGKEVDVFYHVAEKRVTRLRWK